MTDPDNQDERERHSRWAALGIRTDIPHPARVYDFILGGKDNISQVVPVTLCSAATIPV